MTKLVRRSLGEGGRVFQLALGELLWGRRAWFMAIAAAVPVVLGVITRAAGSPIAFDTAVSLLYMRFIVPALGVFYGTSLVADEVEDKTLTYLFTRPIARASIVLGKYLAYLVCTWSVVLPSMALLFVVMVPFREMGDLLGTLVTALGVTALGLAAYGALFLLAGVMLARPLVAGFLFVFGWEQTAFVLPGYLRRLTVAFYLQTEPPGVTSLLILTISAVFFAMYAIERREYII